MINKSMSDERVSGNGGAFQGSYMPTHQCRRVEGK
jgi:hypothetical protein